jgi:RHS repeat-associated protein
VQGTTPTYYLSDGLGSTMALTDGDGDIVNTYDYDVFGSVRSSTGSHPNEFRFTGEQVDAMTGLHFLRARYYDPAIGRFLSRDPFAGLVAVPQSLNRYAYVLDNPINWIDPWGLRNLEGTPTPTPAGMVQVCAWVSPEGCEEYGPWVEIPRGGHEWGLVPYVKEQITRISNWFMNTCPGQATRLGVGVTTAATGGALALAGQEWGLPLIPLGVAIANPGPPSPPLENCW